MTRIGNERRASHTHLKILHKKNMRLDRNEIKWGRVRKGKRITDIASVCDSLSLSDWILRTDEIPVKGRNFFATTLSGFTKLVLERFECQCSFSFCTYTVSSRFKERVAEERQPEIVKSMLHDESLSQSFRTSFCFWKDPFKKYVFNLV